MQEKTMWTRRRVLQTAGLGLGAASTAPVARGLGFASAAAMEVGFAYVASRSALPALAGIYVFRIERERWNAVQFVPSASPSAVVASCGGDLLFVANGIDRFRHLPTGSVESYRVDRASGRLTLLSRQGLALSATLPTNLAVSPDGGVLAVSASGGAAYNLLPVRGDGTLGEVVAARKEIGCGPHPELQRTASPQGLRFDVKGRLIAADLGKDCVSVFAIGREGLRLVDRHQGIAGGGPSQLVMDEGASRMFVGNALAGGIVRLQYDSKAGRLSGRMDAFKAKPSGVGCSALAALPGGWLVSAGRDGAMQLWDSNGDAKESMLLDTVRRPDAAIAAMHAVPRQDVVIALDEASGRIDRFHLDRVTGRFGAGDEAIRVPSPVAMEWVAL